MNIQFTLNGYVLEFSAVITEDSDTYDTPGCRYIEDITMDDCQPPTEDTDLITEAYRIAEERFESE